MRLVESTEFVIGLNDKKTKLLAVRISQKEYNYFLLESHQKDGISQIIQMTKQEFIDLFEAMKLCFEE